MIKSIIAASLALSALCCTSANAGQLRQITTAEAIRTGVPYPLATAVESAGVPVFDGAGSPICQPKDGAIPYAFYNYKYNAILICTNNGTSSRKFVELSLIHI